MSTTLIVISDLHMGSGPLDDFEPEIEEHFVKFLEELRNRDGSTELVINGDLLDFVQAPPYKGSTLRDKTHDGIPLCFTEEQSRQKLEAIHSDHKKSFEAIRDFLAHRPANRLVLLPGNHDADFYWSGVQKRFCDLVCGNDRALRRQITYYLDPVYRPAVCPNVWIEHGHQHDPINSFVINGESFWSTNNPPILTDRHGAPRLYECIGTRFMIQYLNDLDLKYPYVDNVKPFTRFLQLFGASALRPGYGPIQAAVAVASMNAFLAKTLVTQPKDVLSLQEDRTTSPADLVLAAFEQSTASRQQSFIKSVIDRGYVLNSKDALTGLARLQANNTVTTDRKTIDDLTIPDGETAYDFYRLLEYLAKDELGVLRGERIRKLGSTTDTPCYSLRHDAVGLVLVRWKDAREATRGLLGSFDFLVTMFGQLYALGGLVIVIFGFLPTIIPGSTWVSSEFDVPLMIAGMLAILVGLALPFFLSRLYRRTPREFIALHFQLLGVISRVFRIMQMGKRLTRERLEALAQNPVFRLYTLTTPGGERLYNRARQHLGIDTI